MLQRKQDKQSQAAHIIALTTFLLFVAISSIGFPLIVSLLLLNNQMSGLKSAFVALLIFAAFMGLLLGTQLFLYKQPVKYENFASSNVIIVKLHWLIWVLITLLIFLITNHLLVRGLAVGIWDTNDAFYPYQVLVADFARSGRLVYWDPWSAGGQPLLGDPQVGAFSPITFIVGLLTGGTSWGFKSYWLLTWFFGGFGIFMLARHLKAPAWGASAVALGFLFCGVYTGNAQHTCFIAAFSFLPVITWRLDVSLCSGQIWPSVEAGALWGLSALAGYPGFTIITGCYCTIWALGRYLTSKTVVGDFPKPSSRSLTDSMRPAPIFVTSALGLMLLIGLLILSPTYFAFLFEGVGTHARVSSLSRDIAVYDDALDPNALSTFASPYLATLKANDLIEGRNEMWQYTDASMCSIYTGAPISVLALFAIFGRWRDKWLCWLVAIGILALACAIGRALPLRGWLYDWLYPMRFFRHAAIFRSYYVFSISVLALYGTRDIALAIKQRDSVMWKRFLWASVLVGLFALLCFLKVVPDASATTGTHLSLSQTIGTALIVSGTWLGVFGVAYLGKIFTNPSLSISILLLVVAGCDAFLTNSISQVTMISTDPPAVNRWRQLDLSHSSALDLDKTALFRAESSCCLTGKGEVESCNAPDCHRNDQYITKIPVFDSYATMKNPFHLEMVRNTKLRTLAVGTNRIWFSKEVCEVAPTEQSFSAFIKRTEELGHPPLVIHTPEKLLSNANDGQPDAAAHEIASVGVLPPCELIAVELDRYSPDELDFHVQCAADGWLLVTDRWARGWHVAVNDKPSVVYGGNFIFRAIRVSAGYNDVKFHYSPTAIPFLVIVSWGTLAVVAVRSPLKRIAGKRRRTC